MFWEIAYFNLIPRMERHLLDARCKAEIIFHIASRTGNSFIGGNGFKGYVPAVYQFWLVQYLKKAITLKSTVRIGEMSKPFVIKYKDGTEKKFPSQFHSKGQWIIEPGCENPSGTSTGSSNYNFRSANLDTEINFYFTSADKEFQKRMKDELDCHAKLTKFET